MSYYRTCEQCGAHLDPGESCDCGPAPEKQCPLFAALGRINRECLQSRCAWWNEEKRQCAVQNT